MERDSVEHIDDIDLAAALAATLGRNPLLPATILVDVSGGIVTLQGEVEHPKQREEAEAVARRFHRVAGVINAIALRQERPAV